MKKFNSLKWKCNKTLQAQLKELDLPEPASEYGFTDAQLFDNLANSEYKSFWKWMYGQTMMLDPKTGQPVVYVEDVIRGVKLARYGTATYFD